MERWSFVFTCSVYLNIFVIVVSGLTLHNCIEGWIDIPEDTSAFIICRNIPETEKVTWTVENAIRTETIFYYVCESIAACNLSINETSLQRYRDDGVSLVINRNHRRYEGFAVTCSTTTEHAECRMRVFQITRSRPPSETTREMHTKHPTQPLIKTSQVTHVTTFPNSKVLGSSPSDRIDSSPSPQNKSGLSVATGVIAGVVVAVVATVIVIVAIAYVSRRYRNRPDFEEQYNVFYISADALALNTIRPVDDLPQSRVQVSDSQASPQTSSDFTDTGCMVQMENNSIVSPPAHQNQTTQPCWKELEEKRESAMSNTEDLYAVVADKDLRGSKPRV